VATAWLVLPVRSTGVLRLRIADSLAMLANALDPATALRRPEDFLLALDRVERVAPAFRASRLLTGRFRTAHPADWVDALIDCRQHAISLIENGETPGEVRKAIGAARKAMREPEEILRALQNLHRSMTSHV